MLDRFAGYSIQNLERNSWVKWYYNHFKAPDWNLASERAAEEIWRILFLLQ